MSITTIIDRIKDSGLSDRLLSKRVVCEAVDLSLAELNRRVARGAFPKPCPHGSSRVVWKASVIDDYIRNVGNDTAPIVDPRGRRRRRA